MIPLLLLQVSMFQAYVSEAGLRLKVPNPVAKVSTITASDPTLIAWVWNCRNPADWGCGDPVIYIASDAVDAPILVLRYLAYHEVCHLKLGHNTVPMSKEMLGDFHNAVRRCVAKELGWASGWALESQFHAYSHTLKSLRRQRFNLP